MQKLYCILILLLIQVHVCVGQQSVPPQDDKSRISVLEYQLTELKAHNAALQQQLELRADMKFQLLEARLELKSEDVVRHGGYVDTIFLIITIVLAAAAISVYFIFKSKSEDLKKLKKEVEDEMKLLKAEAEKAVGEIKANKETSEKLLKLSPEIDSLNSKISNNKESQKAVKAILDNPNSTEFEKTYAGAVDLFNNGKRDECIKSFQSIQKADSHQIGIELRSMIYTYMSYCYHETEKIAMGLSYNDAAIYLNPGNENAWLIKGLFLSEKAITYREKGDLVELLKFYKESLECFENYKELSKADDADGLIETLKELIKKAEAEIATKKDAENTAE